MITGGAFLSKRNGADSVLDVSYTGQQPLRVGRRQRHDHGSRQRRTVAMGRARSEDEGDA